MHNRDEDEAVEHANEHDTSHEGCERSGVLQRKGERCGRHPEEAAQPYTQEGGSELPERFNLVAPKLYEGGEADGRGVWRHGRSEDSPWQVAGPEGSREESDHTHDEACSDSQGGE